MATRYSDRSPLEGKPAAFDRIDVHACAAFGEPAGQAALVELPLGNRHREIAHLGKPDDESDIRVALAEVQDLHRPVTPVARRSRAGVIVARYPTRGFHPAETLKALMNDRRASATRSKYK